MTPTLDKSSAALRNEPETVESQSEHSCTRRAHIPSSEAPGKVLQLQRFDSADYAMQLGGVLASLPGAMLGVKPKLHPSPPYIRCPSRLAA